MSISNVKGRSTKQPISEYLMANIVEDMLEELEIDSAIIEVNLINKEKSIWSIDLTGNCGQVIIKLENISNIEQIKEVVRVHLNDVDYYRNRSNISYFINSLQLKKLTTKAF
jgi:hypothetical protein